MSHDGPPAPVSTVAGTLGLPLAPAVAASEDPVGESPGGPRGGVAPPVSAVIGLIVGGLLFASTQLRLRDVDLYWHIRAGRELLSGVPLGEVGASWTFAQDPRPWKSTQWLSEVGLYGLHEVGGWQALVVLRTLTAAITVALLARATLRERPALLAAFPFLAAATAAVAVSQERPNQATLIGAAALGAVLVDGLTQGRVPRWWSTMALTCLWANLHGGWVLVPFVLGLVAAGRALDHGPRDPAARRAAVVALLAGVAGSLTPLGPSGALAVLRFTGATDIIQEWRRTVPMEGLGLLTLAMLVLIALAWTRRRPRASEGLACGALLAFTWTAVRNVAPGLLVLAPLVAAALVEAFPRVGRDPEPRWSRPVGIALACALLLGGLLTIPRHELRPADLPFALARAVADLPGDQRVLNDYNVAGLVLLLAGPGDRVAVDGRADRYSPAYLEQYIGAQSLEGDWQQLLDRLAPTSALLERSSALTHVLLAERGWRQSAAEGDWVLLVAPGLQP